MGQRQESGDDACVFGLDTCPCEPFGHFDCSHHNKVAQIPFFSVPILGPPRWCPINNDSCSKAAPTLQEINLEASFDNDNVQCLFFLLSSTVCSETVVNHSLHFEQQGGGGDGMQQIGWQKCGGFGTIAWHGDNCEQIII